MPAIHPCYSVQIVQVINSITYRTRHHGIVRLAGVLPTHNLKLEKLAVQDVRGRFKDGTVFVCRLSRKGRISMVTLRVDGDDLAEELVGLGVAGNVPVTH